MWEPVKRMAAVAAILGTAGILLYATPLGRRDGGLFSLFRSDSNQTALNHQPESYSLSSGSGLDLSDVEVLAAYNEESARLVARTVPSVVSINTLTTENIPRLYSSPQGLLLGTERQEEPGLGSGVIVTPEGHVITNNHVIDGVDEILVTLHDGRELTARLVAGDPAVDIAVLRIDGEKDEVFPSLSFADSDEVRVGEHVIAVGNPFGLGETVTRGIISARDRRLSDGDNEMFQTDTVINPGNSGGPLINVLGEIVGINVAIYSVQSDAPTWQGVGLAIPANAVAFSFDRIMKRGRPVYGHLGVSAQDLPEAEGPVIISVAAGSPGESAGLAAGDVVLRFGDERLDSTSDLVSRVLSSPVGEAVPIRVRRHDGEVVLDATIGERPVPGSELAATSEAGNLKVFRVLGATVRDFTERERAAFGAGVLVIKRGDPGQFGAALRPGDTILHLGETRIENARQFASLIKALIQKDEQSKTFLHIIRNRTEGWISFRI